MRAYSIENRSKGENRRAINANQHIQTADAFYSSHKHNPASHLRRCESSSALNKKNPQLANLECKYKALEQDYRRILKEVKSKAQLFASQKEEIQRMHKITEKDEREIKRLKELIRIANKNNLEQKEEAQYCWPKGDETELTSETREEKKSTRKLSREKSVSRNEVKMAAKLSSSIYAEKDREKAPLAKRYKFVPSLAFKHL